MTNSVISGSNSYSFAKSRINCEIYLNDKNPNKGIKVEIESINRVDIWTNIFSFIPTFYLELIDNGRIFNTITLKENMPIYIKLYKPASPGLNDCNPWVESKFIIKDFQITPFENPGETTYAYQIVGTGSARLAMIEKITYPDSSFIDILNLKKTSLDVIKTLSLNASLGFNTDINAMNDASNWLEINTTVKNAIDDILNYSYLADDDIALAYVDLDNTLNVKSLKNATNSTSLCTFMSAKLSQKMQKDGYDTSKFGVFIQNLYRSLQGSQADKTGYKSIIQYDPWNTIIASDIWKSIDEYDNGKFYSGYQNNIYKDMSYWNSNIPSRNSTSLDIKTDTYCGVILNDNLHANYNRAPIIRKTIFNSFFVNQIKFSCPIENLGEIFDDSLIRPQLMKNIDIDLSTSDGTKDFIHSGKYLVTNITYSWELGNKFTLGILAYNNGTNSKGALCK